MKVIPLQDVARIGKRFEIVNVPDGHAFNFPIPRRMAEPATPENVRRVEERKGKQEAGRAAEEARVTETLTKLDGTTVAFEVAADAEGHLFKGIKAKDIAVKIRETIGELEEDTIILPEPLKMTGSYEVTASTATSHASFTVTVTAK